MGTSIHKEKSGEASPAKFLGGIASRVLPGKAGNIAGKMLNPMGAAMDNAGMADTTLGKVLNPMSLLNRK